ncbi:DUF2510 domain-containing protein [Propionibacteriaceae bacterium Y2011]
MSGQQGWYPDPGGQPGMFRYWNGREWSQALSPTPSAPPPRSASPESMQVGGRDDDRRQVWPWLLVAGAAVVALIVIGAIFLPGLAGRTPGVNPNPGGETVSDPCPPMPTSLETPKPQPGDGRVHGGPLSYPQLGSPWGGVQPDLRVPFGRDVAKQQVMVEENYRGSNSWVASILVAELMAGDGFFSPEQGSEIVARCVLGVFYGDAIVERDDKVNQAATIDGHEAWILESHLSFDIEGLETKGELLIIAIVAVDDWRAGIYYASIPDTRPDLVPAARESLEQLKVTA